MSTKPGYRWDNYFSLMAELAGTASKDSTKVGAALVSDNSIRMTGFNGPPRGVQDLPERRERPAKYLYAAHAERNLIDFCAKGGISTEGATVYVTHHPCAPCACSLIQAGVKRVVYGPGTTSMAPEQFEAAAVMFSEAGVTCEALADLQPDIG